MTCPLNNYYSFIFFWRISVVSNFIRHNKQQSCTIAHTHKKARLGFAKTWREPALAVVLQSFYIDIPRQIFLLFRTQCLCCSNRLEFPHTMIKETESAVDHNTLYHSIKLHFIPSATKFLLPEYHHAQIVNFTTSQCSSFSFFPVSHSCLRSVL